MAAEKSITTPSDAGLEELCSRLAGAAAPLDVSGEWPAEQLRLCGKYGVYRWFMPQEWGGLAWSGVDVIRGYLRLSAACLTTTFIITQRTGACRRIAGCDNAPLKDRLLPPLVSGESFATLGISHLTTSRRHLKRPVLRVAEDGDDFVLDGFSPWVTGSVAAETVVTGGTLEDGRQALFAVPADLPGVKIVEPVRLINLTASKTGEVRFKDVRVGRELLIAGPVEDVMSTGNGAATGGLQTSTLAVGLATAAIGVLEREAQIRDELKSAYENLDGDRQKLEADLLALAGGNEICSNEEIRQRANSLALRASQAALTAAKGSGYIVGHPAGRYCQQALFFLVWSCPQPVLQGNLCEFAGIPE